MREGDGFICALALALRSTVTNTCLATHFEMAAFVKNRVGAQKIGRMFSRQMSGHSMEEAIAETEKWRKISYGFLPVVGLVGIMVMGKHFAHHHEYEQVMYPFIKKRDKPMPWNLAGGTDCDLFDYACSAKIKAAQAAAAE